ncbi:LptF/LptG family permease, partial [bacterium]|nr:LptF/LptG family permease [bacterium]
MDRHLAAEPGGIGPVYHFILAVEARMIGNREYNGIKTVDLLIAKTFLRSFFGVLLLFVVVGFVIVLFNEFDNIRENNIPFGVGLTYILLYLPHELVLATPIIVVLSVILGIGNLVKNREMLMLYVSGYTPMRLGIPLSLLMGLLVLFMFFFNEYVSAPMAARAQELWRMRINANEEGFITASGIWLHGEGNRVYHVREYHPHLNQLRGLMIFEFLGDGHTFSARLNAAEGVWNPTAGGWT